MEDSEVALDEDEPGPVATPMATALLEPRMLEVRAAYSRLSTRRDRLAFLRHRTAVAGSEAQIHGERMYVERQPELRRMRLRAEPRPPGVMGIRATDRRLDDVTLLIDVLPAGTDLLDPPQDDELDDDDYDDDESSMLGSFRAITDVASPGSQPSRTPQNWRGVSPMTDTTDSSMSAAERRPHRRRHGKKKKKL